MESLFPGLLFLGPFFAPLIIRIGLAIVFAWEAKKISKDSARGKARAAWSLLLAVLFAVGLFTQLAALAGAVYVIAALWLNKETSLFREKSAALLAVVMLLSLVITGAGFTPFPFGDLPY